MTLETKKMKTSIMTVVLLSSLAVLAIQIQTIDTDNLIPNVYAGPPPTINPGDILLALEDLAGEPALVLVDPVTGVQTFFVALNGLSLDQIADSNGDLIVATDVAIVKIDPVTGAETVIANAGDDLLSSPAGMDLNAAGDIIVLDEDGVGNGIIVSVDPVTGAETLIISEVTFSGSTDMTVEPSGDILVLVVFELYRVDPIGGTFALLTSDVLGGTERLITNDAGDIFAVGTDVVKIDPISGTPTVIATGFDQITGIGLEDDGNLIVVETDEGSIVHRVDPVSGASTIVSSGDLLVDTVGSAITVYPGAVVTVTCQGVTATIVGTDGDDMIVGTIGDDVIDGQNGNDVITGLDGNDIICGGGGDDFIDGGNGNDAIRGNPGKDVIIGGEGNDFLRGEAGKDNINGGSGNDTIEGGDQDDIIIGGSEDDDMDGGLGVDICEAELNDTTTDCETITVP